MTARRAPRPCAIISTRAAPRRAAPRFPALAPTRPREPSLGVAHLQASCSDCRTVGRPGSMRVSSIHSCECSHTVVVCLPDCLVCRRLIVGVGTYMYVSTLKSIVCEWHQFQGLNVVIYRQYRQKFRACGGQGGNLIFPFSRCNQLPRTSPQNAPVRAAPRPRRRATSGADPLRQPRPTPSPRVRTCRKLPK